MILLCLHKSCYEQIGIGHLCMKLSSYLVDDMVLNSLSDSNSKRPQSFEHAWQNKAYERSIMQNLVVGWHTVSLVKHAGLLQNTQFAWEDFLPNRLSHKGSIFCRFSNANINNRSLHSWAPNSFCFLNIVHLLCQFFLHVNASSYDCLEN